MCKSPVLPSSSSSNLKYLVSTSSVALGEPYIMGLQGGYLGNIMTPNQPILRLAYHTICINSSHLLNLCLFVCCLCVVGTSPQHSVCEEVRRQPAGVSPLFLSSCESWERNLVCWAHSMCCLESPIFLISKSLFIYLHFRDTDCFMLLVL